MTVYWPGCHPQHIIWTEAKLRSILYFVGDISVHKLPFGLKCFELKFLKLLRMDSDWDIIIISRSVDEDKGVLHTVHVHYIISKDGLNRWTTTLWKWCRLTRKSPRMDLHQRKARNVVVRFVWLNMTSTFNHSSRGDNCDWFHTVRHTSLSVTYYK
jgi:hypothetical protein